MTDSNRPDPSPEPEPVRTGSNVSDSSAVSEARMHRPQIVKRDLDELVRKIQYDLDSARVKLTELRSYLAAADIPETEYSFNEERALALVRNTAHEYTDTSLADELALRGADASFIDRALMLAAEVRREEIA